MTRPSSQPRPPMPDSRRDEVRLLLLHDAVCRDRSGPGAVKHPREHQRNAACFRALDAVRQADFTSKWGLGRTGDGPR